jgi:hypothetical protein
MANIIELFNTAKLNPSNLTGTNNPFNSIGELTESARAQTRFLTNVDYTNPENFIKFGSAEEYYKNAINYIAADYPYDGHKAQKLKWINGLTDFEYHLFYNEYPRYSGYLQLSGAQYIGAYSPSRDISEESTKNIYVNGEKYFVNESLNFTNGFTFESWLLFNDVADTPQILNINTVFSSSAAGVTDVPLLKIFASSSNLYISGTEGQANFSYQLTNNSWKHYAVAINNNSSSLFVNGDLQEKINTSLFANTASSYVFYTLGLIPNSLTSSFTVTGSYTKKPVFKFGSGSLTSYDETRFWNRERTIEQIGRNWFTNTDGNDFTDVNYSDLILYYKYNEGWVDNSGSYCLDYSGFKNFGYIFNYNDYVCRVSGSAINSSSLVQDVERGDVIYVYSSGSTPVLSASADYLVPFYNEKVLSGTDYDVLNTNMLYKKFPSWMLEQEQEAGTQHLKKIIQIISVYFDDLYIKIKELASYKHLNISQDTQKLYPFYDKILTSTGFNVTDLFNNLTFLEKIASRTEVNIFDEDIAKIKNLIFQNIYSNLSYILKSKGTEKSLKSFLRSYGIGENLVRINLYPNGGDYTISDQYQETVVKKKTITLTGSSNIYLSGTAITPVDSFTLESAIIFPKNLNSTAQNTASILGLFIADTADTYNTSSTKLQVYVTAETGSEGSRFCFRTGSTYSLVASSSYFNNLYNDTIWNISIGLAPNLDDLETNVGNYNYLLNFRAVNTYKENSQNFQTSSISAELDNSSFYSGSLRYFIGANNELLSGSTIYNGHAKYLYCNFWTKELSDNEILNHNKDILNYGVE